MIPNVSGPYKTSVLSDLKHYSNDGLRATFKHISGIQQLGVTAKEESVVSETQVYLDAISTEATSRKVNL